MKMFRCLCAGAAIVIASATLASADTLHATCTGCNDNGTVTPTMTNPPTFSFKGSNNHDHGDFYLVALVPDNKNAGFSLTLNATNTGISMATGSLFSSTEWNSGSLSSYLHSEFSTFTPPSPIGAYLPSTQSFDAGANGYFVYLFDFGAHNYTNQSDPTFTEEAGSLPGGSLFVALLTDSGTHTVNSATAQSGALFVDADATPNPPGVPEPSSLALFGSGVIALAGLARRRFGK